MVIAFFVLLEITAFAQGRHPVTGTVQNSQGVPLVGVSVSLIGGGEETQTDTKGSFRLEVSSLHDSLRFSFVGYVPKRVGIGGVQLCRYHWPMPLQI